MKCSRVVLSAFVVVLSISCYVSAADKKAKETKADDSAKPSYELAQPAAENLDLTMYQRIREEGLAHSHIMEFASALTDGIGPRLTGSPNLKKANEWTRDQLTAMGCTNAHLEDWGEFGMGWRQLNTWVRMSAPGYGGVHRAGVALVALEPRGGEWARRSGSSAKDEKDLEKYKGKLAGKIIFFGAMRDVKPVDKPLWERRDDADLKKTVEYPVHVGEQGAILPGLYQAPGISPEGREVFRRRTRDRNCGSKPRWTKQWRVRRNDLRRWRLGHGLVHIQA